MKKNGFTLVELLAVIVILAVISTIAVISVTSVLDSTKEDISTATIETINRAAQLYFQNNYEKIKENCEKNGKKCKEITINDLIDAKLLDNIPKDENGEDILLVNFSPSYNSGKLNLADINKTTNLSTQTLAQKIKEDKNIKVTQDDDGTTYYFHGKVSNNYVKISNKLFRIVRLNGDGTIRLIYNNADNEGMTVQSLSNVTNKVSQFAASNLEIMANFAVSSNFCEYSYESEIKSVSNLKCQNTSSEYLKKKQIGLLTYEEVFLSNNENKTDDKTYLTDCTSTSSTNRCGRLILGTNRKANGATYIYITNDPYNSFLSYRNINSAFGVIRPVININNFPLTSSSGSGTKNNPYVLKIK